MFIEFQDKHILITFIQDRSEEVNLPPQLQPVQMIVPNNEMVKVMGPQPPPPPPPYEATPIKVLCDNNSRGEVAVQKKRKHSDALGENALPSDMLEFLSQQY